MHTNETWKAKNDESIQLVLSSEWDYRLGPPFLNLTEKVDGRKAELEWQTVGYNDQRWQLAEVRSMKKKMSPMLDARRLTPRPIPALPEKSQRFDNAVTCQGGPTLEQWNDFLLSQTSIRCPENSTSIVEVGSNVLTTGFLELECLMPEHHEHGEAKITMICSESYENDMDNGQPRAKGNRRDFKNGKLYGPAETYICHPRQNHYEPFWWRTFRYIRLEITCTSAPLTLSSFTYRSTHYPLPIQAQLTSTPYINDLWEISLNTLRNCMHETYEDCPFYEQNQFAMDSRSQILFSYLLSRDDRLARKTIHEFYASRRDDGLVETHFPNPGRSINIPQFSLYWILMIHDHMVHFNDIPLIKTYIGAVDNILNHFDCRINELGLVGKFDEEAWPFIDWVQEWSTPGKGFLGMGIPKAYFEKGAATFNSLVYAVALQHAAELCEHIGRYSTAKEYKGRALALTSAVNSHCFDRDQGLYLDGPGAFTERSQHVQVFAVLAGASAGEDARKLMRRTVNNWKELSLTRASFAMSFYVFRAVAVADIYEEVWDTLLAPWRKMISEGLTTWAESESMVRSDCHGWSATPMYEIVREVVGVRPAHGKFGYGYANVSVKPRMGLVTKLQGSFVVGAGETIDICWDTNRTLKIGCSKDMELDVGLGGTRRIVNLRKSETLHF